MSPEEREAIKARCDAATPGPWGVWEDHAEIWAGLKTNTPGMVSGDGPLGRFESEDYDDEDEHAIHNAVFAAAARTDVPALLAEVERLTMLHDIEVGRRQRADAHREEVQRALTAAQADNARLRGELENCKMSLKGPQWLVWNAHLSAVLAAPAGDEALRELLRRACDRLNGAVESTEDTINAVLRGER